MDILINKTKEYHWQKKIVVVKIKKKKEYIIKKRREKKNPNTLGGSEGADATAKWQRPKCFLCKKEMRNNGPNGV